MTASTADRVLQALTPYDLKQHGADRWRCNSPLRPGSNSHAFTLVINGDEHGAYYDFVSNDHGSLYQLAAALGVPTASGTPPAARETVYTYTDAQGAALFEVLRYYDKAGDKHFVQRQPGGVKLPGGKHGRGNAPLVLYRLPEVLAAVATGEMVYIVEGEKDVETLRLRGLTATCNAGGAGKWNQRAYNDALHGARVVILPDNDQPGQDHADQVQAGVLPMATEVRRVDLPGLSPKGDVSDWLAAGRTVTELQALVAASPPVQPPTQPPAPAAAPGTVTPALGPTAALAAALLAAGYRCELNVETNEITVNGEPFDDIKRDLLRAEVRDQRLGPVGILAEAVTLQAWQHRHAPIREGLGALHWDGGAHVARLADSLRTAAGDVIAYADGSTRRAALVFLERWLLGAVGRVFNGEQNPMLVLDGPQNIGKSSLAKWLGGVLPGVFCEETPNPQDKDSLLRLTKTLVWEAGELDATTRKHDVSALKHFLTRSTVTARRAYARFDVTKPVLASFIGTVNSAGNGFLADPTGNRRFLVLSLTGIDWSYQQLDVRQLWAEVVARYQAGERGALAPEEAAYRDQVNAEQHQTTGLMDDWLAMHFVVTHEPDDLMTSGEIADVLASKFITLSGSDRAQAMAIAEALTRAGLGRADRRAVQKRYGDFRRAWAGIAPRLSGGAGGDPTSGGDPTLIQPRAKVGSSPRNAANSPLIQPIQPQANKNAQTGAQGAATSPTAGDASKFGENAGSVGSVGSESAPAASRRHDPTSAPNAGRLDQPAEVGSGQMPAGWKLRRCDHKGNLAVTGAKWLAEGPRSERTDPCDSPEEAVVWARIAAQHKEAA